MAIFDGQDVDAATVNPAFLSRLVDSDTIGKVGLKESSSADINDAQAYINKIADADGTLSESDTTNKNYSSTTVVANGDSRKVAIGKIDAELSSISSDLAALDSRESASTIALQSQIDTHETRIDDLEAANTEDLSLDIIGSTPNANGASLSGQVLTLQPANASFGGIISSSSQDIPGNKTFKGSVVVEGDFEVQGTTTTFNTQTLDVEDSNVTVNKGGSDASAEGAGFDVERVTANAGIRFDSSLTSKFKLGLIASLSEVIVAGFAQTISGIKSFSSGLLSDTIGEVTSAAGVTVDGVLLKDGLVSGRNVATDGSMLDGHVADIANPHSVTKTQVGLSNVTNDAQLKRAAADFSSFTEKTSLVGNDVFLIEDSADSNNKKYIKYSNFPVSSGGGGGGGSLQWIEAINSPVSSVENKQRIYLYAAAESQSLTCVVKVPNSYTAGNQIKMRAMFYSAATSGNGLMQTVSTLVRTSVDSVSSTTNQRTSTNSAVSFSGATVDIPFVVEFDLTSATGQINSVSVSANDLIFVDLKRGTDTSTEEIKALVYGAEVITS